jgi:glycine cleavage system aminomethyltransferase T
MSLHADRVPGSDDRLPGSDDLAALVHRAGAERPAGGEAAHYGSAAGELAALSCGVGLAERSGLTTIALEGPPAVLEDTLLAMTGGAPVPGGAVVRGDSWWCGTAADRVLVVTPSSTAALLLGRLDWHRARRPGLRVRELGADHVVLGVLGARAGELLAGLGVYGERGDPRRVAPVLTHPVAGADVLWLLRSDRDAVAVVARADAARVWQALREAGRPLRISVVGRDAIARYALAQRRAGL